MKIKDLPLEERPREKAIQYGTNSLSIAELIAILVASGVKNHSALDIANSLLSTFGGLKGLINVDINELLVFKGLKVTKALALAATFELIRRVEKTSLKLTEKIINGEQIFKKYQLQFTQEEQELLLIVMLTSSNRIIKEEIIYRGVTNAINISIREIMNRLVKNNAAKFILVHNHPSGDLKPSQSDEDSTYQIKLAADLLGITMLDHIIIGNYNYYSFCENNII